jgi:hypothetical protein
MPEMRVRRLHPPDHRLELEVALPLGIDAGRGAGELHELADLGEAVRHERGDRDGAQLLQREVEQHELREVRQRRHHAVKRPEPELEQVKRQVVGQLVDLRVGVVAVSLDEGRSLPVFFKNHVEFLRERLVLPVALRAVALHELRRKRHDALQHVRSSW